MKPFIPKSWNGHAINDGTKYNSILPGWPRFPMQEAVSLSRMRAMPAAGNNLYQEMRVTLLIALVNPNDAAARWVELSQWFDPRDNTSRALVVTDPDGSNERYIMARCLSLMPADQSAQTQFIAQLLIDGLGDLDGRFRSVTADDEEWEITASGQTKVVNNGGDDDAYPILTITPTTAKTSGFAYKRWIPIRWNVDVGHSAYPLDIANGLDIDALVTAGKVQADGDDLRVYNNGLEINRYLDDDVDSIWVSLPFAPKQEATLEIAIAGTGDVLVIDVNEDISSFPSAGVLMIDDEAFVYTNKVTHLRRFTGVTRAQRGTSMAAHTAGDVVWWVQNDLWLYYGDSTLSAPTPDPTQPGEPAPDIDASTNALWNYQGFGANDGSRPAHWVKSYQGGSVTLYMSDRNVPPVLTPWAEIGIYCQPRPPGSTAFPIGRWAVYNPCGIDGYEVTDGEKYALRPDRWNAHPNLSAKIQASFDGINWIDEESIAAPSVKETWESWTSVIPQGVTDTTRYLGLYLGHDAGDAYLEISSILIYLDENNIPTIAVGDEQDNYQLEARITNNTTGEAITVSFNMVLDESLTIDTNAKTVVYSADSSNQFQAFDQVDGPRRDWLRLAPGNNELQFDDTGTGNVTIDLSWEKRWWH